MIIIPTNCATAIPTDPNWPYVSLLVKDLGINGATNNSFHDDGPYNFLPTRSGDVTQGSFSPFGPLSGTALPSGIGGGSAWFNGSSQLNTPTNSALALGTGDFTVECWYCPAANITTTQYLLTTEPASTNGNNGGLFIQLTSARILGSSWNGTGVAVTTGLGLTGGAWTHLALVRQSGTVTLYVNGISAGSYSDTANLTDTQYCVGGYGATYSTNQFKGTISNFRVVKGTAVYTSNFTLPTAPLTAISGTTLLTCQSPNSVVNVSSNSWTLTNNGVVAANTSPVSPFGWGSVYMDHANDYLSIPTSSVAFGTSDFTIEGWFYENSTTGLRSLFGFGDITTTSTGILFRSDYLWLGSNSVNHADAWFPLRNWFHAAVSRSSGTTRVFINGVQVYSVADSTNYSAANAYIGTSVHAASTEGWDGYISNFRVVKGTGLYTSNFTPATAPLSPISGTSLLTCQDKGVIADASSNSFAVTRVGDTKPVGMSPFAQKNAGYWSVYFDGSANITSSSSSAGFSPGSRDFTLEGWIYPTQGLSGAWAMIAGATGGCLYVGTVGGQFVIRSGGSTNVVTASSLPSLNTWTHVVAVRSGNNMSLFFNGTRVGTVNQSPYAFRDGDSLTLGNSAGATTYGYISNLRMVLNQAVYDPTATTITVPTSPLTAIPNTALLTFQDARGLKDSSSNNLSISPSSGSVPVSRFNPFGAPLTAPTTNLTSAGSITTDNASGSYMTVPASSNWVFSGDYTIEAWVMHKTTNPLVVWATGGSGASDQFTIGPSSSATATDGFCFWSFGLDGGQIASALTIPTGQWYHVALSRVGSTLRMFINGTVVATKTGATSTIGHNATGYIGARSNLEYPLYGNISNLRIVNGTGLYTTNFAPSASPLTAVTNTVLLTCQDGATVTDASSSNVTVTKVGNVYVGDASPFKRVSTVYGGSAYFDGTGDWLVVKDNPALEFGAGSFTVEFWINTTQTTSYTTVFSRDVSNNEAGAFIMMLNANASGDVTIYSSSLSLSNFTTSGAKVNDGAWHHVAFVRNGSACNIYVDGVSRASTTTSGTLADEAGDWYVGSDQYFSSTRSFNGYLSGLRVVKGVAVYTANFDPPTAPVSAVGGTSLLLNFDNAGIYDASGKVAITSGNNAKTSTAVKKYSLASTDLATSGSYLKVTDSVAYTGDWTVEFWIYPTQNIAYNTVIDFRKSGTNLYVLLNGTSITNFNLASVGGAISTNVWSHVAIVRSGGTQKMYINGTQAGAGSTDSVATYFDGTIGVDANLSAYPFLGYLEDFRITKGIARYTAAFTPPALEAPTRGSAS